MAGLREQFLECFERYEQYRRINSVPVMIDVKLQLLASCITKTPCQANLYLINPEERQGLEVIDNNNQMILFKSIAGCLMGDGAPNKVKEAFIKRDRTFASWEGCYISYDHENLFLTRKSKEIVPLTTVKVSPTIKEKSGRFVFAIELNNSRYYLALPTEDYARNMLQGITDAKQKDRPPGSAEKPSELMASSVIAGYYNISPVSSEESLEPQMVGEFNLENIEFDDGYKIAESFSRGRVLVSQTEPNCTKLVMVVQSSNLVRTLELYCQPHHWNPLMENFSIVNRLHDNVFVMYERYKPHDLASRCRDFVFVRAAVKRGERLFVVEKSVEHPNFPEGHSIVRGKIKERVVALIPHPQDPQTVMMVIRMNIDFGGFNSTDDNIAMAVAMLKHATCFRDYCAQKELLQHEMTSPLYCFKTTHSEKSLIYQRAPLRRMKSQPPHDNPAPVPIPHEIQLIDLIQEYYSDPLNYTYLDLVVNKQKQLELPLKHRYTFEVQAEEGRKHIAVGPGNFIFQNGDWKISEDGEFVFLNQRIINAQKDVLKWVVSQVCSNLIRGKSIMNMSMPVDIFDDRSFLERNACCFGYAPIFLKQAGKVDDEVEQMRLVMTFMLSQPTLYLRQYKPFNPILGYTFQGFLGGIPICYEQISHHPPISSFYMKCPEYELYGNIIPYAEVGLNSGLGGNSGIIHIKFPKNDTHFECITPPCEITGLILGERRFKMVGKGFVFYRSRLLFGEVSIGKDKKYVYPATHKLSSADLTGGVFRVSSDFVNRFLASKHRHKFDGLTHKDKYEQLSYISGLWNDKIKFNGQIYKYLMNPIPFVVRYYRYPLPSSCNYRYDVIYKRLKNLAGSQSSKEKLYTLQRADKKLRHH